MARIDAWGSKAVTVDARLIKQFGLSTFTDAQKKPFDNRFFTRGLVIAHRDFARIAKAIKEKKPFLQMTGIATSGPLHLGHKVDIDLFEYFRSLGAKSHFGVCDIDGYVSRPDNKVPSLEKAQDYAVQTVQHLLALGVPEECIYVQSKKEPRYYTFAFELSKKITENTFKAIYGHLDLGKLSANLLQYADILHGQLPEYDGPMPSLTSIGIEQDPHARAARDLVRRLPYNMVLPSFLFFKHQSGLKEGSKMSASEPDTAIFLTDSEKDVRRKIDRAFSGGRTSVEEHRRLGGDPDVDRAFEILLFHHPDDAFVADVKERYASGDMLTGELKTIVKEFLVDMLKEHQKRMEKYRKTAERIVHGA